MKGIEIRADVKVPSTPATMSKQRSTLSKQHSSLWKESFDL